MATTMEITIQDVLSHKDELNPVFGSSLAYANVSSTQLSIARHYGGCKIQGKHFVYNSQEDSLIREDVVKWLIKHKKSVKAKEQ